MRGLSPFLHRPPSPDIGNSFLACFYFLENFLDAFLSVSHVKLALHVMPLYFQITKSLWVTM
jgi:hypothetical protein